MEVFFAARLEFLLFAHGLMFLGAAWLAFGLRRSRDERLPWTQLAVFALGFGLCEWSELFAERFQQPFALRAIRIGLLVAAYLALLDFARAGLPKLGGPVLRRRLVWPLLGLAGLGALSGGTAGLEAACRYAVVLPAGLTAAWILWRTASSFDTRSTRLVARIAALSFACHGLIAGLVVPEADFPPASMLNQEVFFRLTRMPPELPLGVCGLVLVSCLWWLLPGSEAAVSWKRRLRRAAFPAAMLVALLLGLTITEREARSRQADLQQLMAAARAAQERVAPPPVEEPEPEQESLNLDRPKSDFRAMAVIGAVMALLLTLSFLSSQVGGVKRTPGPRKKPF